MAHFSYKRLTRILLALIIIKLLPCGRSTCIRLSVFANHEITIQISCLTEQEHSKTYDNFRANRQNAHARGVQDILRPLRRMTRRRDAYIEIDTTHIRTFFPLGICCTDIFLFLIYMI